MRRKGLARTFQRNELFLGLTVTANARLAVLRALGIGPRLFSDIISDPRVDDAVAAALARVGLTGSADTLARDLAYGEQRQIELALALTGDPKILLLDEPTAGMSPGETQATIAMLAELPRDITVLIVEHDMDVVFALADRVTVLNLGEVLAEGDPREIQKDARVISLYLGQYAGAA
jgi:branched-chain amino acid transport system ATP-binding protein